MGANEPDGGAPSETTIRQEIASFDIGILDTKEPWKSRLNKNARSFVRACLSLDDAQRPTATQALQHRWLAHPEYTVDMQAKYKHAIKDWKPRVKRNNLVEYIDLPGKSTDLGKTSSHAAQLQSEVKFRHFSTIAAIPPYLSGNPKDAIGGKRIQPLPPIGNPRVPPAATSELDHFRDHGSLGNNSSTRNADYNAIGDSMPHCSIQDFAPLPSSQYPLSAADSQLAASSARKRKHEAFSGRPDIARSFLADIP